MKDHLRFGKLIVALLVLLVFGVSITAFTRSPEDGGAQEEKAVPLATAHESAPVHSWARFYHGPLNAWYQGVPAYDILETDDGGYVTAGNVNTCENSPYCTYGAVVRYNSDGSVAWTRIFGQASAPSTYLTSVVQTTDGGYAATGYTAAGGIGGIDLLVVKLDPAGTVLWQNTYGRSESGEYGQRIYQNADGTLTVTGSVYQPGFGGYYDGCYWGSSAAWSLDISSNGAMLSNRIMGANASPTVSKTSDGGNISAMSWGAPGIGWTTTLQKFDSTGAPAWSKSYYSILPSENGTLANGSVTEVAGGYVVSAYTYTGASGSHICIFKVDGSGAVLWSTMIKDINGDARLLPGQIETTADGGSLVAMTSGYSTVDTRTLKCDANGAPQWATAQTPTSGATFLRMKPHSAGGYIIAGAMGNQQALARADDRGTLGPLVCPTLPIAAAPFTRETATTSIGTMAGPDTSVCNSHFVNPTSHPVSLLVQQGDYALTQACIAQFVSVWTPDWAQTGTQPSIAVQYINTADVTAHNTVVLVDLPLNLTYVGSTSGGIYYPPLHQVFWKLGDVSPVGAGMLSVTVDVPWGEPPHSWTAFLARIAADNIPGATFDRTPYLNYVPVTVDSETVLTPAEIGVELANDPALEALYDHALAMGYQFFNNATRSLASDGSQVLKLFLLSSPDAVPAQLVSANGIRFVETINNDVYTLFDVDGGYSIDQNQGLFLPWGTWAQQGAAEGTPKGHGGLETYSLAQARCQLNCTINSIPEQALKMISKEYKLFSYLSTCKTCAASMAAGNADRVACAKCGASSAEKFSKTVATNLPGIGTAVSWSLTIKKCYDDCAQDPSKHICTDEKRDCTRTLLGALAGYDSVAITPCNKTLGIYAPVPNAWVGCLLDNLQKCVPGQGCVNLSALCNGTACKQKKMEIRTPHDPNDKLVDFKGDVLPGQLLHYTVEYENTGSATATGVFVQDMLDDNLDESTLTIGNGGIWSAGARQITWNVGDLAPGVGGSVGFSVQVKNGLTQGTEIVNAAEVNFPNALEVTPTNAVVSHVSSVAADPQTVGGISGTMVPVALSGRDASGGAVTYAVTLLPSYGTLTGTPPGLTYIPDYQFSGQDVFYYTATGASGTSQPARVTLNISPNPADVLPPAVAAMFPAPGATGILFGTTPASTNPDQYLPTLWATFSEPLDATTVSASTFVLDGKPGTVWYDEETHTAYFAPSSALAASTLYTARLKKGIKDKAGNALMTEFAWNFTTETPVGLMVTLPDNGACVTFPATQAGKASPGQTVSVTSTGTLDLVLGTLGLTGANPGDFRVTSDLCSGRTLAPRQNCTCTVAFSPGTAGSKSANLSIPSNNPATPALAALTGSATAPPCVITCTASAPGGGNVGTPVAFSATATPTNCSSVPTYAWAFGDGQTSAQQNPSHAYASAGAFTWTLAVSADGATCAKSGVIGITEPCTLSCSASASSRATSGLPVAFTGSATPSHCSGTVAYDWNFGDGASHATTASANHAYNTPGAYSWTFTAVTQGTPCAKTGSVTVVAPPVISLIKKVAPPFKLVVLGSNFQNGIKVYIGGVEWTSVIFKNTTKIQITGGKSLKLAVPKGTPKTFRFVNPDGGEATQTWGW